jgi:hypothetical protein
MNLRRSSFFKINFFYMKRLIFLMVTFVAVAIVATINVGLNLSKNNNPSSLTLANIDMDAFTEGGESGGSSGGNVCKNFKSGAATINGDSRTCCKSGADIDWCDFNLEHPDCAGNVTRPARTVCLSY